MGGDDRNLVFQVEVLCGELSIISRLVGQFSGSFSGRSGWKTNGVSGVVEVSWEAMALWRFLIAGSFAGGSSVWPLSLSGARKNSLVAGIEEGVAGPGGANASLDVS